MAELALLKPHFESKIYIRAVDLKQYPCLRGDLPSYRIVFTSRPLKAAILLAYEALWALLRACYDCGSVPPRARARLWGLFVRQSGAVLSQASVRIKLYRAALKPQNSRDF